MYTCIKKGGALLRLVGMGELDGERGDGEPGSLTACVCNRGPHDNYKHDIVFYRYT